MDTRAITFNNEQNQAIAEIEAGRDVLLLGAAGTGKSEVAKEIIKRFKNNNKSVVACAPTGLAANNIGGGTIHSSFALPNTVLRRKFDYKDLPNEIVCADLIVIDEISMVRADYITSIINISKMKSKPAQLLFIGDFKQLAPIISKSDREVYLKLWGSESANGFAFETAAWKQLDPKIIELSIFERQKDRDFLKALNMISELDYQGARYLMKKSSSKEHATGMWLYPNRQLVANKNMEKINSLPGEIIEFNAKIYDEEAVKERNIAKKLSIKEGCRVMCIANDFHHEYVNGSIGMVIDFIGSAIRIMLDNGKIVDIDKMEFKKNIYDSEGKLLSEQIIGEQYPLQLAYAMTHHKCQGLTLDKANIDPKCFSFGELYTVLTRVRCASDMYLCAPISCSDLKGSAAVSEFYKKLRAS